MRAGFGLLFILSTSLVGCAEGIPPIEQLAATQGAIRAAEEAGAAREPQAELHLKLAHEQLDKAKVMMDRDDNEEAGRLLQRASADAEVARAYARKVGTVKAADDAQEQINKLKTKLK
jgi:hypothetical protein